MRFQAVGDTRKKRAQVAAKAALDANLPVLLNEALQNDPVRSAAIELLAKETLPESPDPMPTTQGFRPRVTIPRNLDVITNVTAPTPELTKLVCCLISEGMPVQRAFRGVGLVRAVWERWWEQGEADAADGLSTPYSRFVVELMREDVDVEAVIIRDMMKRKAGVWQAGMTFLERRAQDTYALQPQGKSLGDAANGILEYFSQAAQARGVELQALPTPPSALDIATGQEMEVVVR